MMVRIRKMLIYQCATNEVMLSYMAKSLLLIFYLIFQILNKCFFFFLNDTATTEISPLPLPDALPIFEPQALQHAPERDEERYLNHKRVVDTHRAVRPRPALTIRRAAAIPAREGVAATWRARSAP